MNWTQHYSTFCLLAMFAFSIRTSSAEVQEVVLKFEPATPGDAAAVKEYEAIWAAEGSRIIQALQERSGLSFEKSEIRVVVVEAPSNSGFKKIPMSLRSSYPLDTKKATLIHELGHRLQGRLFRKDDEDHPFLFLYLYDVWVSLYGKEFADEQVKVESARRGIYDYETAWRTALAMTAGQRIAKWQEFLNSHKS